MTALFGGLFIAAGILTFQNPAAFDILFIAILIFTASICKNDTDVLGVITIILLLRALDETVWFFINGNVETKFLLYSFGLGISYYLRHDWAAKLLLVVTLIISAIEIYWFITEYPPPEIYWNVALIIVTLIARNLIFSRVSITESWFNLSSKSINLDWTIFRLYGLSLIVQVLVVLEYLIRHLTNSPQVVFFYYANPYIMQVISMLAIWVTFQESYKLLLPRLLKA
ncbi:hypothetical protein [Paraglaciecola mesophila]|nr:hypothetical protein [Paraglaciecola mesophila]